jgi:hypothetical protein
MRSGEWWQIGLAVGLLGALGCGQGAQTPAYDDGRGFSFTPPPGWVERVRDSAAASPRSRQGHALPLPPLDGPGQPARTRLLARYDRVTAGRLAWLRLAAADAPASTPLSAFLRPPGDGWRREGAEEQVEVSGQPAARASFLSRWEGQEYRCETTAVRRAGRVYAITASFPAGDSEAREQVRAAVAGVVWR